MNTRENLVKTTCDLLENQGYHATAMSQIVAISGSPRGSMYYHFPGGKEELAEQAVLRSGEVVSSLIKDNFRDDLSLEDALADFILGIARGVEISDFRSGSPLTTVAMETATTNERLNAACQEAFKNIQSAFSARFITRGLPQEKAENLAELVVSAIEGATILSRTYHSGDPLRRIASFLKIIIKEEFRD